MLLSFIFLLAAGELLTAVLIVERVKSQARVTAEINAQLTEASDVLVWAPTSDAAACEVARASVAALDDSKRARAVCGAFGAVVDAVETNVCVVSSLRDRFGATPVARPVAALAAALQAADDGKLLGVALPFRFIVAGASAFVSLEGGLSSKLTASPSTVALATARVDDALAAADSERALWEALAAKIAAQSIVRARLKEPVSYVRLVTRDDAEPLTQLARGDYDAAALAPLSTSQLLATTATATLGALSNDALASRLATVATGVTLSVADVALARQFGEFVAQHKITEDATTAHQQQQRRRRARKTVINGDAATKRAVRAELAEESQYYTGEEAQLYYLGFPPLPCQPVPDTCEVDSDCCDREYSDDDNPIGQPCEDTTDCLVDGDWHVFSLCIDGNVCVVTPTVCFGDAGSLFDSVCVPFCFDDASMVRARADDGVVRRVPLRDVKDGDALEAVDEEGRVVFSKLLSMTHVKSRVQGPVLAVSLSSGDELRVSGGHYVATLSAASGAVEYRAADELRAGDAVQVLDARRVPTRAVVRAIRAMHSQRLLAPLTRVGRVVVENVVASSFTRTWWAGDEANQHALFLAIPRAIDYVFGAGTTESSPLLRAGFQFVMDTWEQLAVSGAVPLKR